LTTLAAPPIVAPTWLWRVVEGVREAEEHMPEQKKINIELRDEEAEGIYSNFAVITHSPAEFVLDFIRVLPGAKKSRVHARIVMAPQNAKALLRALEGNVTKYEDKHGEISTTGDAQPGKQIGFQ
jgi:hypothetical protein